MKPSHRIPVFVGLFSSTVATLAVSVSAFASQVCLVAPNGGDVFVRDAQGNRTSETWTSRTLANVDDRAMKKSSGAVFARTLAGEQGYVSIVVLHDASDCQAARNDGGATGGQTTQPTPEPVAPSPVIPEPKPEPVGDKGASPFTAGDPFGCGSSAGSAQCNRTALKSEAAKGRQCSGYSKAREDVFMDIDTRTNERGQRYIQSPYSNDVLILVDNRMPSASKFNIEHTWPQSKLKEHSGFETTRADKHHLFAIESKINGQRGNQPFCDVAGEPSGEGRLWEQGNGCFEVPEQHKGIAARAMFYMSALYNMSLDAAQEQTLRNWNRQYPVTQWERDRMHAVSLIQGNVNPFVDHPEYVELITDF